MTLFIPQFRNHDRGIGYKRNSGKGQKIANIGEGSKRSSMTNIWLRKAQSHHRDIEIATIAADINEGER